MSREVMRVVVSLMIFQACDWGALDRAFGHSRSCLVVVNPLFSFRESFHPTRTTLGSICHHSTDLWDLGSHIAFRTTQSAYT